MPNMTVRQFIKKYFKKLFIGLHEMKKKHERLIDLEMQFWELLSHKDTSEFNTTKRAFVIHTGLGHCYEDLLRLEDRKFNSCNILLYTLIVAINICSYDLNLQKEEEEEKRRKFWFN